MGELFLDRQLDERYRVHGAVVVPVVDPSTLPELRRKAIDFLPQQDDDGFYISYDVLSPAERAEINDAFRPLFSEIGDRWFDGLEPLMTTIFRKWGDDTSTKAAHQGWSFVDEDRYPSATLWIPLEPVGLDNGVLAVLPGSHRLLDFPRPSPVIPAGYIDTYDRIHPREMAALKVRPGEGVVFSHRLVHASPANHTERPRLAVGTAFVPVGAQLYHWRVDGAGNLVRHELPDRTFFETFDFEDLSGTVHESVDMPPLRCSRADLLAEVDRLDDDAYHPRRRLRLADPARARAGMFLDADLDHRFAEHGVVVVPAVDPHELPELRAKALDLVPGSATGLDISSEIISAPERAAIDRVFLPMFASIGEQLFEGYEPLMTAIFVNWPDAGSGKQAHQGWSLVDEEEHRSVTMWLALEPVDRRNGTLAVLPGSQTLLEHPRPSPYTPTELCDCYVDIAPWEMPAPRVEPGEAIVFDHRLVHSSTVNVTDTPRVTVGCAFLPKGAQLYHWAIEEDGTAYRYALEDDTFLKTFELGGKPNGPRTRYTFVPPACDRLTLLEVSAGLAEPASYHLPMSPEDLERPDDSTARDSDVLADDAEFLRWVTLDVAAVGNEPDALGRMLSGDLDGVTIRGALTPPAAEKACAALGTVEPAVYAEMGSVAPMPLLSVIDDFDPYLDGAEAAARSVDAAFGFSIVDTVSSILQRISGDLPVEVAQSRGRRYLPGTFRTAAPGHGGLRAHTANLFLEMNCERGLRQLVEHLDLADGISWFFVVQAPQEGGPLRLFDARWPEDPTRRAEGAKWADDDTGVEALRSTIVPPRTGDLIVFRGGDLWHAVDDVGGNVPRVTYGGFLAPRRDRTGYEFWS